MQKMFLSTPPDDCQGRFNKFRRSIGKFRDDVKKNRRQLNFEEDFLGKPCIYFLNVFGIEAHNGDTPAEITVATPLTFRSSDQQEVPTRVSISLSQNNLVGKNMRLRIKCKEQEEKLARQEVELKQLKEKLHPRVQILPR